MKLIKSRWISPQEVRAETWALGFRHRGMVLEGARLEMLTPGLSARRSVLLQAVVRAQTQAAAADTWRFGSKENP